MTRGRADSDFSRRPDWARHAEHVGTCERVAPLIDGVEYFRAVREVLLRAQRQVLVLGWDFHSEITLLRGDEAEEAQERDGYPVCLGDLLERLVEERPELQVSLLIWEGAYLFALERQHFPRMKRPWAAHERIRLVWDRDTVPMGSQHQKIIVVDDRIALLGGIDLTRSRWDDHAHQCDDERRRDPGLVLSNPDPRRELGIALDGEGARALGSLARARWHRVVGEELAEPMPSLAAGDAWPPSIQPMLRDQVVALAVTQPPLDGVEEKRQVEWTYLEQIAAAKRLIFIENQYFTSDTVCDALCERLRDPDGPEVVVILPYGCPATIQAKALDPHRDKLIQRLRDADPGGRLGVYWPTLRGGNTESVHHHAVYIHSKTMVVDDVLLRIGSANLANRSMGLDTECDAFCRVDADDHAAVDAIASYRRSLLSHVLDVSTERIAELERRTGSCVATINELSDGDRTLHPFDHCADVSPSVVLPIELADPSRPLSAADTRRVAEAIASNFLRRNERMILAALLAAGALAALWWWPSLRSPFDPALVTGLMIADKLCERA